MSRAHEAVDILLALHRQTDKGWKVSLSGDERDALWLPKAYTLKGDEPCGGFQRLDHKLQRMLITIYEFTVPGWLAAKIEEATA